MEWWDALCAWVMSVIASLLALFGISSVSEACCMVEPVAEMAKGPKASEVLEAFAAQAAQVAPIIVDLSEAEEPSNM